MENKLLMTLANSLVATIVFWIAIYLFNGSVSYVEIAVFFIIYFIAFYIAGKYLSTKTVRKSR